jgi:hypothetical protein
MIGRKILLAASLLLLALAPVRALAVDVKTQASTQYLWYNDPFQDKTQGDLLQYVKLSATKIDAAGRFSTVGYGRVSKQFGSSGETDRGDSDDVLGRIYFLYMNYAIPEDRGDVRLGRQMVSVGAGTGTIDGVRVDVRNYGPVAISLFGGYDVRFAETSDRTKPGNYLAGASAGGSFFKGNNVEVSYLRKYDESDIIREMAGVRLEQTLFGKIKGYADLRYDMVHQSYAEFLAGIQAVPSSDRMLTFTAEYYSSYPTFDADTIYTAFAVTRYREALGRADWIVNPAWTVYGSYTRADYDGPTADVGTIGVRNRSKSVKGLTVSASVDVRRGYPGDLTGFRASADYAFGKKALLAAGVAYDSFQRDSMQDGFDAKKFWVGGSCEVRKNMAVKVRVEDAVTRLSSSEVQGRASVDFSF